MEKQTILQTCPVCSNEWEFDTQKQAQKAWLEWLKNAIAWVRRSTK